MNLSPINPGIKCVLPEVSSIMGSDYPHEAHKIMAIFLKSGGDLELTRPYLKGKKLEFYADQFTEDFRRDRVDLTQFFLPHQIEKGRELFRQYAEGYVTEAERIRRQEELNQREIKKCEARIALAHERMARNNEKIAQADEKIAQADEKIAQADEKIARADEMLAEERKLRPVRLATIFHGVFSRVSLSDEQVAEVIEKYLKSGSLTTEEYENGLAFAKINSTDVIIQFFSDHPDMGIKTFDFRGFDRIESARVQEIADFLRNPATACIKGIAFKAQSLCDLDESKRILDSLAAFRSENFGKFVVQCK